MRILGAKSTENPSSASRHAANGRRKKRTSALKKLRCHFTCVNCSTDTMSVASDVQYHSLLDAPMYLPQTHQPHTQEQAEASAEVAAVEDEMDDQRTNLSLFSTNRNSSLRRYPVDEHLLINDDNDDDDDENIDCLLSDTESHHQAPVTHSSSTPVFNSHSPFGLPRISLGSENIGSFANLLGSHNRGVNNRPSPEVTNATIPCMQRTDNSTIGNNFCDNNDANQIINGDFNDSVNNDMDEAFDSVSYCNRHSSTQQSTNTNPNEDNQNILNSDTLNVPTDSDFADITSDLLTGSSRSSVLIDFTDNFSCQQNPLHTETDNPPSQVLNAQNDEDSSLERNLPIHLLSLFENPSDDQSDSNQSNMNNEEQPPNEPAEQSNPFSFESLFNNQPTNSNHVQNLRGIFPVISNENESHQSPFHTLFSQTNTQLSNQPNRLPTPLLQINLNSNSNRSSSNGSNSRTPLQQNWYIYDPRLVPTNRQDRLNLHMVWRGIHTEISSPAMIGPPAYDELSSHHSDDEGIPSEPPPPYIENIEVSPIPPPPTYDEAVFNSLFSEFERENLGLATDTIDQENDPFTGINLNSDRYLPNYRPLIIQNAQLFTNDGNTNVPLQNTSNSEDLFINSEENLNTQSESINFMGGNWDSHETNEAFDSVDNQHERVNSAEEIYNVQRQGFALSRFWNRPRWNNTQCNSTNFGISCRLRNVNGNLF